MALYLDYNASTPVHPDVLETMIHVYREHYGNAGSRTHVFGQKAAEIVEMARRQVASLLAVEPSEVAFTSGATEANNVAILGLARWGEEHGRKHIVSTQIEHKAVLEPLAYLEECHGFEVDTVAPTPEGWVRAEDVLNRVREDTLLVSVMHANNETGVIQPVKEISRELPTHVHFHVDAAQTAGKLVEELQSVQYDLLTLSGHKMYGPQGIGALVVRRGGGSTPPIAPVMFGGGQERGLRPGTLPVALIAGFGKAAELWLDEHQTWMTSMQDCRKMILSQLAAVDFELNGGPLDRCLPNCVNVSFRGLDSEALQLILREQVAVSNGSACTSASYNSSHVLGAMGCSAERIRSAIRISWGPFSVADLSPLVKVVREWQFS